MKPWQSRLDRRVRVRRDHHPWVMVVVMGPCRRPAPRPPPRMLRQMGRQHWDDGMMKDDYSCCSTESMVVPPRRRGCHGGERSCLNFLV